MIAEPITSADGGRRVLFAFLAPWPAAAEFLLRRHRTVHDFEQNFLTRATQRGGLTLFRASDACAFVDAARAQRVPVLGVETFLLTAEATHPQMDDILDLSGANEQCDTWNEAQHFITNRAAGDFFFEVTV